MPVNRIIDGQVVVDCHFDFIALVNGDQGSGKLFINKVRLPPISVLP